MTTAPKVPRRTRVVVDVDERGRISLARFGFKSTQVVVDTTETGGLILHAAVALTPDEVSHYTDPDAVRLLNEGLDDLREGRTQQGVLRSQKPAKA